MKKTLITTILFSILMLISCGVANQEYPSDREGTEDVVDTTQNKVEEEESPYLFTLFHLEANVENVKIEVEYEERPFRTKASYDNRLNGIKFSGEEAIKELDPIFSSFTFNQSTKEKIIVDEVMKTFVIPEVADRIELEIEFKDGSKLNYDSDQ